MKVRFIPIPFRFLHGLALILSFFAAGCGSDSQTPAKPAPSDRPDLILLSTNDRHSSFLGTPYAQYTPEITGDGTQGGIARFKTLVDEIRAEGPDTLLLDAGDFTDGTIFFAAERCTADLDLMERLGYAAAVLGNHEFTSGPEGLAAILEAAPRPMFPLLCANARFDPTIPSDDGLESLFGDPDDPSHVVYPSIVLTTASGIRVGLLGLLGEAVTVPEAFPVTFPVDVERVRSLVQELRENELADVVVLLMHAGVEETEGIVSGEIADLARKVEGIDVIVAGHSHVRLQAVVPAEEVPGSTWTTTIVEAGDEARFLGRVDLYLDQDRRVVPGKTAVQILPVDDTILGDPEMIAYGRSLVENVETSYLSQFPPLAEGGVFDELAQAAFPMGDFNSMYLVTDAMRAASGSDLAFVSLGGDEVHIDRSGPEGIVRVYDAFASLHRGMSLDRLAGSPLYRFFLTLREIAIVLEATTAYMGQESSDYLIVPSGMRIVYDSSSPPFVRIRRLSLLSPDESQETILYDDTDIFRGAWIFGLGWRNGFTQDDLLSITTTRIPVVGLKELNRQFAEYGLPVPPIEPRTASGSPVPWTQSADLEPFLCTFGESDPQPYRGRELKAWYSVARRLEEFGGPIPAIYDDAYTDGTTHNPVGPPWRRVWDVALHGYPPAAAGP